MFLVGIWLRMVENRLRVGGIYNNTVVLDRLDCLLIYFAVIRFYLSYIGCTYACAHHPIPLYSF